MSEPIRNKKADFPVAPYATPLQPPPPKLSQKKKRRKEEKKTNLQKRTPQNTPANNAPISSHAQQPGVSSIKEGKLLLFFSLLVFDISF
jgi:nucleosome assembly protein 1-like 1